VGILPKPPFYPLFEALRQNEQARVIVFMPGQSNPAQETITGSGLNLEPDFGLVETGES